MKTLLLAIAFSVGLAAQEPDLFVSAVGGQLCADLPGCIPHIYVALFDTGADYVAFSIAYTDSDGQHVNETVAPVVNHTASVMIYDDFTAVGSVSAQPLAKSHSIIRSSTR